MITVITRYQPEADHFDDVLAMIKSMLIDKDGMRTGCIKTELFASSDRQDILTINVWDSKADLESYIDGCIRKGRIMEIQATLLRSEIDSRIYEHLGAGAFVKTPTAGDMVGGTPFN